jgi:serine/threonine-protein kinase HipA
MLTNAKVILWGDVIGAVRWNAALGFADFAYTPEFAATGLEVSPIIMPLSKNQVYRFPALAHSNTFKGLPGLLADSLPEKFGNHLLTVWLAQQGKVFDDVNPVERLCYMGTRGMGALEFEPDTDTQHHTAETDIDLGGLLEIAQQVMNEHNQQPLEQADAKALDRLIQIGTSAGGAKAKAVIAWNETTGEIMSGQGQCRAGFKHYLLKLSGVSNDEHESDPDLGRVEMAYHKMAVAAGIRMMQSQLIHGGDCDHFMTRRFDRDDNGNKFHIQSYCAIAHQDRDPVGTCSYEHLFATARRLGLEQPAINELFVRMVFNLITRNQDDHTKNHAFMMDGEGRWALTPAYDLCFAYKKNSRWIDQHQMRCNGKRDQFTMADIEAAAEAADIRNPAKLVANVLTATQQWPAFAAEVNLPKDKTCAIAQHFRGF